MTARRVYPDDVYYRRGARIVEVLLALTRAGRFALAVAPLAGRVAVGRAPSGRVSRGDGVPEATTPRGRHQGRRGPLRQGAQELARVSAKNTRKWRAPQRQRLRCSKGSSRLARASIARASRVTTAGLRFGLVLGSEQFVEHLAVGDVALRADFAARRGADARYAAIDRRRSLVLCQILFARGGHQVA